MDTTRNDIPAVGGTDTDAPVLTGKETHVVSDQHLGPGPTDGTPIADFWQRHAIAAAGFVGDPADCPNGKLEDFYAEQEQIFDAWVRSTWRTYWSKARDRELCLNGDIFDVLPVSCNNSYPNQPVEAVYVKQIRRIAKAHPIYFGALRWFLSHECTTLVIHAGNHDLCICWPGVKKEIILAIAGYDRQLAEELRSKIRFVDDTTNYRDVDRGVMYVHAHEAEPHNYVAPKDLWITERYGQPLKRKVMNEDFGAVMTRKVVNPLKRRNFLVGRLYKDRLLWKNAFFRNWPWSIFAGLALVWYFIWSQLFNRLHFKRKSSIWTTIRIAISTIRNKPVRRFAGKILAENEDIKVIVCGHDHERAQEVMGHGLYLNTGTWALTFDLREPDVFSWQWLKTGLAWKTIKSASYVALAVATSYFVFKTVPRDGWKVWDYTFRDVIPYLKGLGVFIFIAATIRFLAVKPQTVKAMRYTSVRIRHEDDGQITAAQLLEFFPEEMAHRQFLSDAPAPEPAPAPQ